MCYRKKTEFEVFSLEIPGYPFIKVFDNWYMIKIKTYVYSNHKTIYSLNVRVFQTIYNYIPKNVVFLSENLATLTKSRCALR